MINKKLMVIIPDLLSSLSDKGELIDRYYNPGSFFSEVHIVMTNDDQLSKIQTEVIQKSVGDAKLYVHQIWADHKLFIKTLGWRSWLLNSWVKDGVKLASDIQPDLIRCHGNRLNAYLAYKIKKALNVPYVISMHSNPDVDDSAWLNRSVLRGIHTKLIAGIGEIALKNCDCAIAVYDAIVPYYKRVKVPRFEVIYNIINPNNISKKSDYSLHSPIRLLCVGRQVKQKNPENIIRAVSMLDNAELMIVGKGPIHEDLVRLANELNAGSKIKFLKSMSNDEICKQLVETDVFLANIRYWGIPKAILEPLLSGVPAIVNVNPKLPVAEYTPDIIRTVHDTELEYLEALQDLISDNEYREALGRNAYRIAREKWDPERLEQTTVDLYKEILSNYN